MSKKRIKRFTKAERKRLGLDKFPDTMYDLSAIRPREPRYQEYEPINPKELDFNQGEHP